eukprot:5282535-Amphidinium_carterae.2
MIDTSRGAAKRTSISVWKPTSSQHHPVPGKQSPTRSCTSPSVMPPSPSLISDARHALSRLVSMQAVARLWTLELCCCCLLLLLLRLQVEMSSFCHSCPPPVSLARVAPRSATSPACEASMPKRTQQGCGRNQSHDLECTRRTIAID